MNTDRKLRRRWFSFSLRTLFVVVTVVGVYLGWQLRIVRERKAVLAEISRVCQGSYGFTFLDLESLESSPNPLIHQTYGVGDREYARVSRIRRLLGDQSLVELNVPPKLDAQ